MGEDDLFEKSSNHLGVLGRVRKGFHQFGHIIHGDQDIFVSSGGWERSHKIHAPNIEYLDFKECS